jgi:ribonuclease D
MLDYAANDALVLPRLAGSLTEKVTGDGLKAVAEIEHRALPAVLWMQGAGVPFDAGR